MKDGVRCILNGKLDLLSSRISAQKRDEHESSIQPGRHPCSADEVAIDHDPCIHKNRSVIPHQIPSTPMRGHLSPRENTCRTTNQRSGADRKQELFPLNVISDEAKHFFIVHPRLLPTTFQFRPAFSASESVYPNIFAHDEILIVFSGGGSSEWPIEFRIYLILNSLCVAMFFAISMLFVCKLLKISMLVVEAAGVEPASEIAVSQESPCSVRFRMFSPQTLRTDKMRRKLVR